MNLSFQKIFFATGTAIALFTILVLAKGVLIPLSFALLISFILFPITKKLESYGINSILAVSLSVLTVFLIVGGGIFLFSTQIAGLSEKLVSFKTRILKVFADATFFINNNLSSFEDLTKNDLLNQLKGWVNEYAGLLVTQTFNSSASFVTGLVTTIIFTFLILVYRSRLTHAFISFYPEEQKTRALELFKSVQQVGKKYLFGMTLIIIILGIVNSAGLWIIGIDHAFLFGFLAGILAIIPFVGTIVGAAIPVLYAFVAYESAWMALAVVILFWGVQLIESNILSPKIVGGSLKINALAAILSIIIGGSVWGIAGMVLFLPFTAMFKIICEEYTELKPVALLIGDHHSDKKMH